jgi:hypothetical protein
VPPGSITPARCSTSSAARSSASSAPERHELSEFLDVGEFHDFDRAVLRLGEDSHMIARMIPVSTNARSSFAISAVKVARSGGKRHDHVVNRTQFFERYTSHDASVSFGVVRLGVALGP